MTKHLWVKSLAATAYLIVSLDLTTNPICG